MLGSRYRTSMKKEGNSARNQKGDRSLFTGEKKERFPRKISIVSPGGAEGRRKHQLSMLKRGKKKKKDQV